MRLDAEQKAQFDRDGFLFFPGLFTAAETHTLIGRRSGRRHRLGDKVEVKIIRVDVDRRELDLIFAQDAPETPSVDDEEAILASVRANPRSGQRARPSAAPARSKPTSRDPKVGREKGKAKKAKKPKKGKRGKK